MKRVVIMRGISGAGKSTHVRELVEEARAQGASVSKHSADDHFVTKEGTYLFDPNQLKEAHARCLRGFVESIQKNTQLVIVDNTNTTIEELAPYAALAEAYEYELTILTLLIELHRAAKRGLHNVPPEQLLPQDQALRTTSLPSRWSHQVILV